MIKIGKSSSRSKAGHRGAKLSKKRQHRSYNSPEDRSRSPECEKTSIVGKRIENSGLLDLNDEKAEICRNSSYDLVAKLIFAARPKSAGRVCARTQKDRTKKPEKKSKENRGSALNSALARLIRKLDATSGAQSSNVTETNSDNHRGALRPVTVSSNRERSITVTGKSVHAQGKKGEARNLDFSLSSLSHISENKSLIEFRKLNGKFNPKQKPTTAGTTQLNIEQERDKYNTNATNALITNDKERRRPASRSVANVRNKLRPHKDHSPQIVDVADVTAPQLSQMQQQQAEQQRNIDALVFRNIKKNKEKQELEQLKRLEEEEHQRQAKEMLSERNKMIREMNAKSFGRSRVLSQQERSLGRKKRLQHKKRQTQPRKPERQPPSESERRAKLGLVFVDMQTKVAHFKSGTSKLPIPIQAQKENQDSGNRARPSSSANAAAKRTGIREYMQLKREKIVKEQLCQRQTEIEKKHKISQNITHLRQIVTKIFSRTQLPSAESGKHVSPDRIAKSKGKRRSHPQPQQQDYIRYLLKGDEAADETKKETEQNQEEKSAQDDQLMDSIKQNLLSEMRRGRTEPESPAHIAKSEAAGKSLKMKVQDIAEKYNQLAGPEPETKKNVEAFNNESIVNMRSAIKIQKCVRGFLLRGKLAAAKELSTNNRGKEDVTGENPMVEPTQEDKQKPQSKDKSTPPPVVSPKPYEEQNDNIIFEAQNIGKLLQGSASKSQNEKVVHLSQINTLEDVNKDEPAKLSSKLKTVLEQSVSVQASVNGDEVKPLEKEKVVASVETQTETAPAKPVVAAVVEEEKKAPTRTPEKKPRTDSEGQYQEPEETKGELGNSLAEMRLLLGSEQMVKEANNIVRESGSEQCTSEKKAGSRGFRPEVEASDEGNMESMEMVVENEASQMGASVFDRNAFQDFTVKKLRQIAKVDNMSKLIGMREKVLKYKESTERHYIQKMYKAKRLSPKTYQSKRKELEHWVTKEKEDIKKTKKSLAETWKKVAQMIEDTNRNALQIRRILATHTLSYNSDTNSSLLLDSSRPATDREADDEIKIMKRMKASDTDTQKGLKHDRSLDNLSDMLLKSAGDLSGSPSSKVQSSAEKDSPERLPQRQNFKELYESDSDLSAGDLAADLAASRDSTQGKPKADAILIQEDVSSPEVDDDEDEDESSVQVQPPKTENEKETSPQKERSKNLDLPKSESKPQAAALNRSDEDAAVNTEEIGIGWEISLIGQKPANTRNKSEDREKRPAVTDPANPKCVSQSEAINIVPEVSAADLFSEKSPANEQAKVTSPPAVRPTEKEQMADEITAFVYRKLMDQLFVQPFPDRQRPAATQSQAPVPMPAITAPAAPQCGKAETGTAQQMLIQSLASARRRGIRTDANRIGSYLDDLFAELLKTEKGTFISEINRSIVKPALELLSNLQSTQGEHNAPALLPHEMSPIVPLNLYLELEKLREGSLVVAKKRPADSSTAPKEGRQSPAQGFLEECEHIHDKSIFDAVNEALNLIRPYGLNGEPMPWSLQQRILFKSIADPGIIIRNIKNMVGTLPSMEFVNNGKFDEDYFAEVREKQLATLLAQEVIDNEEMWVNYESEETEVGIDLADMALEQLVVEAVNALFTIEASRGRSPLSSN